MAVITFLKLFVSNLLTDMVANIARVVFSYIPTLLWAYNQVDIKKLEKYIVCSLMI
jgi:hypothetical protein